MPYKNQEDRLRNAERYRNANKDKVNASVRAWKEAFKTDPQGYKDYIKDRNFQARYGVSTEEVDRIIQLQEGCCGLCKKPFGEARAKRPAVDHDHATGKIRGVLHQSCNMAIGHLGDSAEGIQSALDYFLPSNERVEEHW